MKDQSLSAVLTALVFADGSTVYLPPDVQFREGGESVAVVVCRIFGKERIVSREWRRADFTRLELICGVCEVLEDWGRLDEQDDDTTPHLTVYCHVHGALMSDKTELSAPGVSCWLVYLKDNMPGALFTAGEYGVTLPHGAGKECVRATLQFLSGLLTGHQILKEVLRG